MSYIQNTIRQTMAGQKECNSFDMRCFVGMIESGEATYVDFQNVGGNVLAASVAKFKQNLDDIREEKNGKMTIKQPCINIKAETLRGIEFTETGQQITSWVSAGVWKVIGEETIKVSDFGIVTESLAVRIEQEATVVFVHPSALSKYFGPKSIIC